jgi:hypothetical protein
MSTSRYTEACMNALMNCEGVMVSMLESDAGFSKKTTSVIEECTNICLGMLQALKENWLDLPKMALLCVGICEECAEICERYQDRNFQVCATVCRETSLTFSDLAKKAA